MKQFSVLFTVIGLGLCSCERHEWDSSTEEGKETKSTDTINLFLHEDHSGEKGDSHSKEGAEHAGEKKVKPGTDH